MATVYAVASAKGGVGKTTTTAAIATVLASSGADVVAIDADIGMANLAGALGVTPGQPTLHDVLAGRADPLDAVREGPEGLRVVPGSDDLDAYASADPAGLTDAVAAFEDADYVLLDAGAGLSHDSSLPLAVADEALLVSTAERSALGDTEKTRQLAERLGGGVAGAAITRVVPDAASDEAGADGSDDPADVLDAPIIGRIPEDEAVTRAAAANRPLPTFAPDAPATRAYRDLTRALTGAEIEGAGIGEGGGGEADADEDGEAAAAEPDGSETAATGATPGDDEDPSPTTEAGGLSGPGDEEETTVADEDPVAGGDVEAETTGETETVGDEHVDGNDLEAMIEDGADGREAFDEGDATDEPGAADEPNAVDDAESAPKTAGDDSEPDDAAAEGSTSDPDDELAGSVPFRDDDSGGRNTVLSEGVDETAEAGGPDETAEAEDPDETTEAEDLDETAEAEDPDETAEAESDPMDEAAESEEQSGGFFSRLFGR